MIERKNTKDRLYHGLPAILVQDSYLIYSPYSMEFVRLKEDQLHDVEVFEELCQKGFFTRPIRRVPHTHMKDRIAVVLIVTKRCNLKCTYCFANSGPSVGGYMTPQVGSSIIENMSKQRDLSTIHFMGGEPTLNFAVIRNVKERADEIGIRPTFYITTHGTAPEPILTWLVNNGFIFKVSWDGLTQGQTRPFAGGQDSGAKVEQTISYLVDKGCNFCVRMTVTKSNFPYLLESVQQCAEMGAKFFHIEPMSPDGRGGKVQDEVPNTKEFIELFSQIIILAEERGAWLINSALANIFSPKDYFCSCLRDQIYHFNPDGSLSLCYKVQGQDEILAERFIIGNYEIEERQLTLHENDGLINRLATMNNDAYPSCRDCFLRFICSGGCAFRNLKANHMRDNIDPWTCQIRMGILRKAILHIYQRALEGKGSCLEGSDRFYSRLTRNREAVKDTKELDKSQPLEIRI